MRVLIFFGGAAIAFYLLGWSLAYLWLVGLDFSYYWRYMHLAWRGGGEIPALLHIYALMATALALVVGVIFRLR
jgi:hypothetical protein